jgi:hypothetical protein
VKKTGKISKWEFIGWGIYRGTTVNENMTQVGIRNKNEYTLKRRIGNGDTIKVRRMTFNRDTASRGLMVTRERERAARRMRMSTTAKKRSNKSLTRSRHVERRFEAFL